MMKTRRRREMNKEGDVEDEKGDKEENEEKERGGSKGMRRR